MKQKLLFLFFLLSLFSVQAQKPRTIVTTDGEIDDVDSFIRMLLYANEFKIEGLIYSSSMWHYKGDGKNTKMISEMPMTQQIYGEKTDLRWAGVTWMNDLLLAYKNVYPKLSTHAVGFPTAEHLQSLIKIGNIDFEGEMDKDTEGSDFIKTKLLDETTEPIYIQIWGGTNTVARALKSIEDEYKSTDNWENIYKKISNKAILFTILDQDATYRKYISKNWKDIKVYYNANQFACLAYPWKQQVPVELQPYLEGKFMQDNILKNHGDLTKMYYSYGDGQKQVGDDEHIHGDLAKIEKGQWGSFKQYDFISEGDSPAYLHLIDVGLGNLENPQFGGWGGRLTQSKTNPRRWEDGKNAADFNYFTNKIDLVFGQTRWIDAIQQDFAARADWCIKDYKDANHAPKITVSNHLIAIKPGQKIKIKPTTSDPDNNMVICSFWQYQEAGTSTEKVMILEKGNQATVTVPQNAKSGDTFHIIIEGKDNGTPTLRNYQRVILEVK